MESKKKITIAIAVAIALGVAALLAYPRLAPPAPRERLMARIMADIYTADAILQETSAKSAKDKTIEQTYHTVLAHYGLSKAEYDSALAWYSKDPQKFASVYERVVAIMTTREDMVRIIAERVDSLERRIDELNDSLTSDLIGSKLSISLPLAEKSDSLGAYLLPSKRRYTRVERDFALDSLHGGHFDVSYKYSISKPGDPAKAKKEKSADSKSVTVAKYPDAFARVFVSYADSTRTTDSLVIAVSRRIVQREAKLSVNIKDSVAAIRARVVFFENKNLKDMEVSLRDIKVTYKPYDVVDTTNYDNIIPSLFAY